jgi:GT2 family glycosyltransferase
VPAPHPTPSPVPAVVVATRDRRESLLRTLARVAELPERPDVVVVDNGSRDGTPAAVAREHPRLRVIRLGANLGAAARTAGVRATPAPVVAFCDDDSWWAPGALALAAERFARYPRLALLAADVRVGVSGRRDPVSAAMAAAPLGRAHDLPGPSVLGFLACGAIVRRSAFLAAGGFHRRFGVGGEEELLALDLAAAGWGLAYDADVVAHHHPTVAGRGVRPGRGRVQLRNALWATWLRRPPVTAARRSARLLGAAGASRESLAAAGEALAGLPWVLRERRPLPPAVERARALLEKA